MAGAGYKLFNTGDVLTAAQVNTYLQEQVVMVFASAAARTTALSGVLAEGMVSYLKDTNATEVYDGSAWVGIANSGDITGVTAGTGISGGGTSGTVTITNSMATEITAAGDIIVGTGSGTFDNLPIGTTGQVLTADTTVSPYKVKWATASGGALTIAQIATGTLSTGTVTVSSLSTYDQLWISLKNVDPSTATNVRVRVNNNSGGNYEYNGYSWDGSTITCIQPTAATGFIPFYQGNLNATTIDNAATIILTNCKSAGFTTYQSVSSYWTSSSTQRLESFAGLYKQSEAVSSIVFTVSSGTFDGGTYTIWGA